MSKLSEAVELRKHMPLYYKNSRFIKALLKSIEKELSDFNRAMLETFKQLFILTAENEKGLNRWESELGIKKTIAEHEDYRRGIVLSKVMSNQYVTLDSIKQLISAYVSDKYKKEVHITEIFKDKMFYVHIAESKINRYTELIKNLYLKKPAHLKYMIKHINDHRVLSKCTHSQLAKYTHKELITEPVSHSKE